MNTLSDFLDRILGVAGPQHEPRPIPIPVRPNGPRR
jgi:hypothetical protein